MRAKLVLSLLAAVLTLPALTVLALAGWLLAWDGDLTPHRDGVARWLTEAMGREVAIEGELRLQLSARPALTVTGLRVANAPWGAAPELLRAGRVELQALLAPLLGGRLELIRVGVEDTHLALETGPDGARNWALGGEGSGSGPTLALAEGLDLRVQGSTLVFLDPGGGRASTVRIDRAEAHPAAPEGPLDLTVEGTWNGEPARLAGRVAPLAELLRQDRPYPVSLRGSALGVAIEAEGTVAAAADPRGLEVTVRASAPSLDRVRAVLGPGVPPGAALAATLRASRVGSVTRAAFDGSLGSARLTGTVEVRPGNRRPEVRGEIEAVGLDLGKWLAREAAPARPPGAPADRHALDLRLPLARLASVDGAVKLRGRGIRVTPGEIDRLEVDLALRDGTLTATGVRVESPVLTLTGSAVLEAARRVPSLALALQAPRVDPALLGTPGQALARAGARLTAAADLKARGEAMGALADALEGTVTLTWSGTRPEDRVTVELRRAPGNRRGKERPVTLAGQGSWAGQALQLEGDLGPPGRWLQAQRALPVTLTGRALGVQVSVQGIVDHPLRGAGLDLAATLEAESLAAARQALGVGFPRIEPVRVSAHLTGSVEALRLSALEARMGMVRAAGNLTLRAAPERPGVDGELQLEGLDLAALLAGSGTAPPPPAREAPLFSTAPLPFEALSALDLRLSLAVASGPDSWLAGTSHGGEVSLESGRLTADLEHALAGQLRLRSRLEADGRAPVPTVRLRVSDPAAEVGVLLAGTRAAGLLEGRAALDLDLRGQGRSLAAIAASLEGRASFVMGPGKANARGLDRLVGGAQAVLGQLFSQDKRLATVNCVACEIEARGGQARVMVGLADTEYSTVWLEGGIDLARETLDLRAVPRQKGLVRLSVAVPVRVRGPLPNPSYDSEATSTALKVGELFAKLNPAYAAYAFSADALAELARDNPCVTVIHDRAAGAATGPAGRAAAAAGTAVDRTGSAVGGAASAVGGAVQGLGGTLKQGVRGLGRLLRGSGSNPPPADPPAASEATPAGE
jgi:uncharacterized protein involved in outer membrane biogenesis